MVRSTVEPGPLRGGGAVLVTAARGVGVRYAHAPADRVASPSG